MITKDQLEVLGRNRQLNKEVHYTIEGSIETAVHSNVESERIGQLNKGHRLMNEAAEQFRNNMAFKAREGQAQSQFQHVKGEAAQKEQPQAEKTPQENQIAANQNKQPPIDTDLGYGASKHSDYVSQYVEQNSQQVSAPSERVNDFDKAMTGKQSQSLGLER